MQKRKCSSHKLESKQRNRTETQHKANHKTENKEQTEKHNRNINVFNKKAAAESGAADGTSNGINFKPQFLSQTIDSRKRIVF